MSVQLQYIQLITDKTNAADLSSDVFASLNSVTQTKKVQNSIPQISAKLSNSNVTKKALSIEH